MADFLVVCLILTGLLAIMYGLASLVDVPPICRGTKTRRHQFGNWYVVGTQNRRHCRDCGWVDFRQ
jgi:hypothetical protein